MEPLRITRFVTTGRGFQLKRPLEVSADFNDGMWTYHSPLINLWGYGERPEYALCDLHENFAYLWDEIAQERDDLLDGRALDIKRSLLDLVAGQPVATDA